MMISLVLACLGVGMLRPAQACDPVVLPQLLEEVAGQIELAARSTTLEDAQIHLRRVARNLAEAEQQMVPCDCLTGTAEIAQAAVAARRASQSSNPDEMFDAMDELLVAFENAVEVLNQELCR